ncbi:MAG TPA: hypothetical protein VMU02_03045 [bacterium]|nr:hypothetical protein [bacterium]
MCYYRCLLCGHVYESKRGSESRSGEDPSGVPDWTAADNSCPVCGGLALPCPAVYCGSLELRARYDLVRIEDLGA